MRAFRESEMAPEVAEAYDAAMILLGIGMWLVLAS
jgi:hypothetical protein